MNDEQSARVRVEWTNNVSGFGGDPTLSFESCCLLTVVATQQMPAKVEKLTLFRMLVRRE